MLVVFVDVVMRYVFHTSFVFTQELEWHLFGFIFLLPLSFALLLFSAVRVVPVKAALYGWVFSMGLQCSGLFPRCRFGRAQSRRG